MAVQTPDVAAVRAVITTRLSDTDIEAIIADAVLIAERCIKNLEGDRQERILVYIAAHLIASIATAAGGTISSDRLGDASRTYSVAHLGKQMASTSYGQTAMFLDPNGCLSRLGRPPATIQKV